MRNPYFNLNCTYNWMFWINLKTTVEVHVNTNLSFWTPEIFSCIFFIITYNANMDLLLIPCLYSASDKLFIFPNHTYQNHPLCCRKKYRFFFQEYRTWVQGTWKCSHDHITKLINKNNHMEMFTVLKCGFKRVYKLI